MDKIDKLIEEGLVNWAKNNPGLATAGAAGLGLVGSGLVGGLDHEFNQTTYDQRAEREHLDYATRKYNQYNSDTNPKYSSHAPEYKEQMKELNSKIDNLKNYHGSSDQFLEGIKGAPKALYRTFDDSVSNIPGAAYHSSGSRQIPASESLQARLNQGLAGTGLAGLGKAAYDKHKKK